MPRRMLDLPLFLSKPGLYEYCSSRQSRSVRLILDCLGATLWIPSRKDFQSQAQPIFTQMLKTRLNECPTNSPASNGSIKFSERALSSSHSPAPWHSAYGDCCIDEWTTHICRHAST